MHPYAILYAYRNFERLKSLNHNTSMQVQTHVTRKTSIVHCRSKVCCRLRGKTTQRRLAVLLDLYWFEWMQILVMVPPPWGTDWILLKFLLRCCWNLCYFLLCYTTWMGCPCHEWESCRCLQQILPVATSSTLHYVAERRFNKTDLSKYYNLMLL